ncbi:MAG: DUF4249 domain-containing protein [Bacteroidetes bacterium]|nr:MAG: DUF4249 domain-containing protein [Bacteroidota bacterium]
MNFNKLLLNFKQHFLGAIIFCGLILGLTACEKNVTVDVPDAEPLVVIEGYIETGKNPILVLSKTLPFFGTINTSTVFQQTIQGARVIIDNGSMIDTLDQIPGIGVYTSPRMTGQERTSYSLRVEVEGKVLSATTYIPEAISLDSVWFKVNGTRDSLGFAWAHLTDPDTLGNHYRWFAQRINRYTFGAQIGRMKDSILIAPSGSVFEDKFINGKSFDLGYQRGTIRNSQKIDDINDEKYFYKVGDTIVVKFCTLDRQHFEFWRTEETQVQNNGNPFASPAPVLGNITGGLGIWGGYACTFDTIIAR